MRLAESLKYQKCFAVLFHSPKHPKPKHCAVRSSKILVYRTYMKMHVKRVLFLMLLGVILSA